VCIIITPKHIRNGLIGLCTCLADLSFCLELGGVGLKEVDACVGFDGVDLWLSTCFPDLNV